MTIRVFIFLYFSLLIIAPRDCCTDFIPQKQYNQEWRIYSLLEDAGLENNNIMYIDFDDQSNAWLATSVGLVHYDGYRWTRYDQHDGLPSNFVRCVKVTSNQRVFVGTDNGVVYFDNGIFRKLSSPTNIENASIRRIQEDPDGRLWFCCDRWPNSTSVGGLHTLKDGVWTKYTEEDGLPNDYIIETFYSSNNERYVLTSNGLALFQDGKWVQPLQSVPHIEPNQFFWTIAEDKNGTVFITSQNEILMNHDGNWTKQRFDAAYQFCKITSTSDGTIVTFSGGEWKLFAYHEWDGKQFQQKSYPFTVGGYGTPEQIVESPDGSVWCVGMNTLFRWTRHGSEWEEYENLPGPRFADRQNRMWFSDNFQTYYQDEQGMHTLDTAINQIHFGDDENIWGWGDGWIGYFTKDRFRQFPYEETGVRHIRYFNADADHNVWFYGNDQYNHSIFSMYDGTTWKPFQPDELKNFAIEYGWSDPVSGIWAITADGSGRYKLFHIQQNSFKEFALHPRITSIYTPKLFTDSNQTVWLYGDSGLFSLTPYPEPKWTEHSGTIGKQISNIAEFHDEIWVLCSGEKGGSSGISVLKNQTWHNFIASVNEVQYLSDDHILYYGGYHCFYMISEQTNWLPHRINLPDKGLVERFVKDQNGKLWLDIGHTCLTYLADRIPPETIVELSANTVSYQQNLNLNVHGVERFHPKTTQPPYEYSYRINNQAWSSYQPISNSEIPIKTLQPGNHSIAVRLRDEDLDIDPTSAFINFIIEPVPLQSRPWFRPALIIIFITVCGLALYAFITRNRLSHYASHLKTSLDEVNKVNAALQETQENLYYQKEKAEDAAKAKSHFLAKMSHEIRTPLNGIIGNLELVLMGQPEDRAKELLRQANISAQTLLGILGNVLDFSKIEANRFSIEFSETPIRDVITDVIDMMRIKADDKHLRLISHIEPNVPDTIVTDNTRFRQVLINLLNNSIKFTKSGGIFIHSKCHAQTGHSALIRFDVYDSGPGFDPKKKDSLFQEFTQEDPSSSSIEGTGLGLAICRRIVEMLHGEIGCETYPGYGSLFWFQIPVEVLQSHTHTAINTANLQVLLLQNAHQGFADGILQFLKEHEITVNPLQDKTQIDPKQHYPFFIHLSDNLESVDSGFIASLRNHCERFIYITGEDHHLIPFQALKKGFDFVLQHPINRMTLLHLLSNTKQLQNRLFEEPIQPTINESKAQSGYENVNPVLVVDDTNTNRILAQNQLYELGFACDTANNGSTALDKAKQNNYSAILLDISMDDMDGFEFAMRFREWEMENSHRVPIIAITAHIDKRYQERCLQSGMDDYIIKPVRMENLSNVLTKWIRKEKS